ncbi:PBSX family phage terminase large subunit [Enorma phocaeensis]|uniref:PBSX family phage terminase large subunit n=1 Tax=Enorma phocaeensis TaxID=1871019 RepID=UPI0023575B95|nr:PBSX family phage terminase large subunit [Enorma phocaeensis]
MKGDTLTQKQEMYCQARMRGLSQRKAYREVYENARRMKDATVDSRACTLEAKPQVNRRLAELRRAAAAAATKTRAEVIAGMSEAFDRSLENLVYKTDFGAIDKGAISGVSQLGKTLVDLLPDDADDGASEFERDFALLISDPFVPMHRAVCAGVGGDFWTYGGRASGKSSCISLEIVRGIMRHPDRSALIMVKTGKDIREGVYEQMLWAIRMLGVEDEFECTVSPIRIRRRSTGQVITFRGGDNTAKTKALKAPAGTYYAYLWIEETDQFAGMAELRRVYQSVTRGAPSGSPFFRFHSFNPPRTRDSWANRKIEELKAAGTPVYKANYTDMPPGWLPEQTIEDAEALKAADPEAYAHEYLGEPVGFGNEVFPRADVREVTEDERGKISMTLYGVDWGFSSDPFCWVKVGYAPKTRTLYVLDSISGVGLTNPESAELVKARMAKPVDGGEPEPFADVFCDSAEPKSVEDFKQLGIRARGVKKTAALSVRSGVRWLQNRSAIVIDPRAALAASEFPAYGYALTPDGEPTGLLPDKDNHAIDAVRYAVATLIADRRFV